jgi:glucosamine 6-phosphate synthetase-like amidotransferase/phosphosugar isomerase protein
MIAASNIILLRMPGISHPEYSFISISFIFSAIIEHTNQVLFMEDDDLAVIRNGALTIHRTQHEVSGQSIIREIIELKIELQQIMKGQLFE